ncbi:MAG TPA: zf-HC2 domain-containing protein [Gemmataceae bacterium]|nr:zf-HC2 domain-containing protein [Gemmataceae bacterium]
MKCTEIRARLLAWQYGELPAAEGAQVEEHLASCAACREQSLVWQELRRKLDAFRQPAVEVDLPRVYQQAVERQERRVRRWRRGALAVIAAAAAVLLAVALQLEIRVDAAQIVFHWGGPSKVQPQSSEPLAPAMASTQPPVPSVVAEDLQLVKDLIRVLAKEIQTRDRRQQEELLNLQTRFETLLGRAYDHWAGNERDVAALYAAQFRFQKKGENP